MNMKEKLDMLFTAIYILLCLITVVFGMLFLIMWSISGFTDETVLRLRTIIAFSGIPSVVLTILWLFSGDDKK
jgi:hypothetical protein